MTIMSFASFGYEGEIIKVEAYIRRGLPLIDIVGLPGAAVKEARERMRAAVANSQLELPQSRILINLSPADQKKDGSGFDLPIALAVLQAEQEYDVPVMVIGELELSGKVRPVCGVLGAILAATAAGIRYFIVPKENEAEACIPDGAYIFGVQTLQEAVACLARIQHDAVSGVYNAEGCTGCTDANSVGTATASWSVRQAVSPQGAVIPLQGIQPIPQQPVWSEAAAADQAANTGTGGCFEDIAGQEHLVEALQIAAAGGHSVLAYGPPGCGKTLSMQRFLSLLPDLDIRTAEEVTRIYSIAGLLPIGTNRNVRVIRPPFRMPHPNASLEGMIGGAGKCMPGEISLAHGGVLFLDEAVQFKPTVLQTLRAPLETGTVTLSRAGRSSTFPARFQLLMALNPCPCGNLGAEEKICTCMPTAVESYWKKLTAPLIDRIDLRIPVFPPDTILHTTDQGKACRHNTAALRAAIAAADILQKQRYQHLVQAKAEPETVQWYKNVYLPPAAVETVCCLTNSAAVFFTNTVKKKQLSGRGSHALLKIARTIADLDREEKIAAVHLEKAAALREWSPFLPDFLR
ncbi:MAG: YifB family Mg chelatase-like AAA ATPase [Treponema sp.]